MGAEKTNEVLLVQEVSLHPNSVIIELEKRFEDPSIIHVFGKESLKNYTRQPIYDENYFVLFESVKLLETNIPYLRLDCMFPVLLCNNKSALEDAKLLCRTKNIPYKVYINKFDKEDAIDLICSLASVEVSRNFCETLIRRVGLSPQRIISAVTVCEQVGYKTVNISRYIDKYIYIDIYDVVESLLGVCRSKAQCRRAAMYLHMNRLWYNRYTRVQLLKEFDTLLQLYNAFTDGSLTVYNVQTYGEENYISRYRINYAMDLFERVSLLELEFMKYFIKKASLLEVSMRLM